METPSEIKTPKEDQEQARVASIDAGFRKDPAGIVVSIMNKEMIPLLRQIEKNTSSGFRPSKANQGALRKSAPSKKTLSDITPKTGRSLIPTTTAEKKRQGIPEARTAQTVQDAKKAEAKAKVRAKVETQKGKAQEQAVTPAKPAVGPAKKAGPKAIKKHAEPETANVNKSQKAQELRREQKAEERQSSSIATAMAGTLANWGKSGFGGIKNALGNGDTKDVVGSVGGPLWEAAKELKETTSGLMDADGFTGKTIAKIKGKFGKGEGKEPKPKFKKDSVGRLRDDQGKYVPKEQIAKMEADKKTATILDTQTEIAKENVTLSKDTIKTIEDGEKNSQRRHGELVRAVSSIETGDTVKNVTRKDKKKKTQGSKGPNSKKTAAISTKAEKSADFSADQEKKSRKTPAKATKKPRKVPKTRQVRESTSPVEAVEEDLSFPERHNRTPKAKPKKKKRSKKLAGILGGAAGLLGLAGVAGGGILEAVTGGSPGDALLGMAGLGSIRGDQGGVDEAVPDIAEQVSKTGRKVPKTGTGKAAKSIAKPLGKKAGAKVGTKAISSMAKIGGGRLLGKAGGLAARSLPLIGQVVALGMAAKDAYDGYNDKEMQQQAFDLKDGQEATTGQKVSTATANAIDMGGLTSGLLGMLGVETSGADMAKGIHGAGQWLGDAADTGNEKRSTGQKVAGAIMNPLGSLWGLGKSMFSGKDGESAGKVSKPEEKKAESTIEKVADAAFTPLKSIWGFGKSLFGGGSKKAETVSGGAGTPGKESIANAKVSPKHITEAPKPIQVVQNDSANAAPYLPQQNRNQGGDSIERLINSIGRMTRAPKASGRGDIIKTEFDDMTLTLMAYDRL